MPRHNFDTRIEGCEVCGDFVEIDVDSAEYIDEPCGLDTCPCWDTKLAAEFNLDHPSIPKPLDFEDEDYE